MGFVIGKAFWLGGEEGVAYLHKPQPLVNIRNHGIFCSRQILADHMCKAMCCRSLDDGIDDKLFHAPL